MKKAIAIIILSVAGMALLMFLANLWILNPHVFNLIAIGIVSFCAVSWSLGVVLTKDKEEYTELEKISMDTEKEIWDLQRTKYKK